MNKHHAAAERQGYLDVLRVFATCAVIILHCIYVYFNAKANFGRPLWYAVGYLNELTRTGVPLFFMISGYLLLGRDYPNIGVFYKRRFLKIGVPFILYDVFYYLVGVNNSGRSPSLKHFLKELFNNGSEYHLWFVYAILIIYLLVPFLSRMVKMCNEGQLWLLFFLSIFQTTVRPFINLFLRGTGVSIFFADVGFTGYVGYVILGYILGNYCRSRLTRGIIYAVGAAFFIFTPAVAMQSVIGGGEMYLSGGYSVNHYAEAAALFLLCRGAVRSSPKAITYLSNISFSAYLIHVFIIEAMRETEFFVAPWAMLSIYVAVSLPLSFLWGALMHALRGLIGRLKPKAKS